ncbi:hypothetical protein SteCoe_10549 [Stentor coeruleus]|uniref:Kinesin-associated protein 3 n=1 Tax=Stentor coeruleus TaxID=5963 RepID=A0A1R2CFG7_9CILI|nr:hypothetical protein SteCoe_10549 [Stentor coeruleus]
MDQISRAKSSKYEASHAANINHLDNYIELLYSDKLEDKIHSARSLLYLLNEAESIEVMLNHESLIGILARTLRDEYKKSTDLSLYLAGIFYVISNFSTLHAALSQNQIGDTSIKIIEYHIQKYDYMKTELAKVKHDMEKEQKKFEILEKKQNKLLFLCFSILLNIAEDLQIERKIKKRKIISYLIMMLAKDNIALLDVVLRFLKKLSIFAEGKNEMHEQEHIISKLQRFVPCPHHQSICELVLKLILNLSFDSNIRQQLDTLGFIPRLVSLLKHAPFRGLTLKILYQLSMDDKSKSTFTYTECLPMLFLMISQHPEAKVGKELVAVAINLCMNSRNAEIISDGKQLDILIKRALQNQDDLIMKLIRNISGACKSSLIQETLYKYTPKFISAAVSIPEMDFVVEVLGVLVNIDSEELWSKALPNTQLLEFIQKNIVPGYAEDDIILECIMLISTIVCSDKCAKLIGGTTIIKQLNSLLEEKQEDDEMVMQIMFSFYKLLLSKSTRENILHETKVVNYLMELLQDQNPRIKKMADEILALVQEIDEEWKEEIKLKRFQIHNQEWLEQVANNVSEEWEEESEDDSGQVQWADLSDLDGRVWGDMD